MARFITEKNVAKISGDQSTQPLPRRSEPLDQRSRQLQGDDAIQKEMASRLFDAVQKNDWEATKIIFQSYVDATILPLVDFNLNALQLAITNNYTALVKEMLKYMTGEELKFQNNSGDTVLAIAARSGNVDIAKKMVRKNRDLLTIRSGGILPLIYAGYHKHRDMVLYLYSETDLNQLEPEDDIALIRSTISLDMYGMSYISGHLISL
jgi:ankyrin repeat protein